MTLLDDMQAARLRQEQDEENSARLAQSYASFTSSGQGSWQYSKRIHFGVTFSEKPIVAYGLVCNIDDLADELNLDPDVVPLPLCTGIVSEWDIDERGFYVGCWIAARVNFPSTDLVDPEAMPVVEHHFTFSAIGVKDIPPDLADD